MAYLEGSLDSDQTARYIEHRKNCPDCQKLETDLKSIFTELKQAPLPEVPDCEEAVLRALRLLPKVQAKKHGGLFWKSVVILGWLLLGVTLFQFQQSHSGDIFIWFGKIGSLVNWISGLWVGLCVAASIVCALFADLIRRVNRDLLDLLSLMTCLVLVWAAHRMLRNLNWKTQKT
jgi:hypothetical protein